MLLNVEGCISISGDISLNVQIADKIQIPTGNGQPGEIERQDETNLSLLS